MLVLLAGSHCIPTRTNSKCWEPEGDVPTRIEIEGVLKRSADRAKIDDLNAVNTANQMKRAVSHDSDGSIESTIESVGSAGTARTLALALQIQKKSRSEKENEV
jgi:hypothetical protein